MILHTPLSRPIGASRRVLRRIVARRWDVAVYLLGVTICSIGASAIIVSDLGAAPYDGLLTGVTRIAPIPFWVVGWAFNGLWAVVILLLGARLSLRQFAHSILFAPIMQVAMAVLPDADSLAMQVVYISAGIIGLAVGIHLFLSVRVMSGLLDTLFEVTSRRFGVRASAVRLSFDVVVAAAGWLLGGAVGVGTVAVACSVAPCLELLHRFSAAHPMVASWRGIGLTSDAGVAHDSP